MKQIQIPHVSLVDTSGNHVGTYCDDPNWWHNLQKRSKHSKNSLHHKLGLMSHKNDYNKQNYEDNIQLCNLIGETPIHIAIMYEDLKVIKYLVEQKGFSVNQRACGSLFQSGFNSKCTNKLIANSSYENLAYFGEYPLAFAACFCNEQIYDYLIKHGADPDLQDTHGNTVLHILVINNKLDMFKYAIKHPLRKANLKIKNYQNLTPLNLAAKLGRHNLFLEMLELRRVEFWR
jgi:ankyrin repeat protein